MSLVSGFAVNETGIRWKRVCISDVTCLLTTGGEENFEVDGGSGEIRTTGRPLTQNKEYVLTVQAVDKQGRKGPHAAVSILAGLRPPQFTNASYTVFVPESTGAGQA